jgi:hypothetical protein
MKTKYILSESLIGSVSVYMILRKLMTQFEDWDACKLGIIDKDGNKKRHPVTSKERESWDMLTRLCWNIKKITTKFIGKSKFAAYFSAAYLLKDSLNTYIDINQVKLDEGILADITCNKQSIIYKAMKTLNNTILIPQHDIIVNENQNDLVEVEIFKMIQSVQEMLDSNPELRNMFVFEDGEAAGATDSTDIAKGLGQKLGTLKRNPLKLSKPKLKRKRKFTDENNR